VKAIFLLGPTASGKTAVALALAQRMAAEIVSVDSAQVYRGMDIGTAKPEREVRARVPHHLIDIVEPTESYSAGRFRSEALKLVRAIYARGRVPIFAGGTMLYFRALTRGIAQLPPAQPAIRAELERRALALGWPELHAELAIVDPVSAQKLEPTDRQRISRALEVYRVTGSPLSALQREAPPDPLPFEALAIALEPSERSVLHRRIAERFRAMLDAGLIEELEGLRQRYRLHAHLPAMRSVGYRQVWATLEGAAPAATLEARGTAATRQLAKRQLTWLRALLPRDDWASGVAPTSGESAGLYATRLDCLRGDLDAAALELAQRFLG